MVKTKERLFNRAINNIIEKFLIEYNDSLLSENDFKKLDNKKNYLDKRINDIILYQTNRYGMELRDFEYLYLDKDQMRILINDKLLKEETLNHILFNELEDKELENYLNNRIKIIEDNEDQIHKINFSSLTEYEIRKLTKEQNEKFQKIRWFNYINEPRINFTEFEYSLLNNEYQKEYMNIRFSNILKYNNPNVIFLDYEWKLLSELKIKKYFDWLYKHFSCGMINEKILLGKEKANLFFNYIKNKFDQLTDYQKKSFVKNRLDEILEFGNAYAYLERYEYSLLTKDERKIYFDFYIPHFNSGRGYKPERILKDCYNDYLEYINNK